MDDKQKYIEQWLNDFYKYVKKERPELFPLYSERIYIIPDEKGNLLPAFDEPDERYATPEQVKSMWDILKTYYKENPL